MDAPVKPMSQSFDWYVVLGEGCYGWRTEVNNPESYPKYRGVRAHVYAWERANGPVPEGHQVNHHCDNKSCTRLDHLYLGDHTQNMLDMAKRGRAAWALFTEDQVRNIRADTRSLREIAQEYDCAVPTISAIRTRRNYSWVE